ncbi:YwaF family protein [Acholeplasma laidlawii]|uniref:YwaF family protein n=1 Tax=Acholeplasma laidlawii TaxID=2148 RepID=A0A553IH74_ACHLA|nr:YwaF family protein [Acholeplasma laidlawii]NWH11179.1 YwaF family protein [Acholeplasma laidlawii]NWH13410.1 YwaF family protein [Acholeplasma laidlawii]NWH14041.1 YwaF family protein [Acholeplasma laidlawii]OAN20421.1 hypothetical protein A2I99_01860 [Acholeplasma laidlawii]PII01852.1 hypothetical protein B9P95_004160 [Acholeplasma laidlawii]
MKYLLDLLNSDMIKPESYQSLSKSWFHYLSLVITILVIIKLTKTFKTADDIKLKRMLLVFGIVMLILEIYKQIIFTYQVNAYQWYAFPFQFCSTPMYLFVIYGLNKNKKVDQYLLSFLATYSTFAGIAVMLYPADVFIETIGINIQTIVHHGLMAAVGFSLLLTKAKISFKYFLKGSAVFSVLMVIAMIMNWVFNMQGIDATFNMFFINERFGSHLPILMDIEPLVPHLAFLAIYLFGFSFVASIIFMIGYLFRTIIYKEKYKLIDLFQ